MLLLLLCCLTVFGNRHIPRTGLSDTEVITSAKETVLSINPHAGTVSITPDAGQALLDRMTVQINAMPAGPQKTAALAALANMRQHAQQNKKKFAEKAKRVLGAGGGLVTTKDKYLNVPETTKGTIPDVEAKFALLQNSTNMAAYKAEMHAAAMDKIQGVSKRNLVVKRK